MMTSWRLEATVLTDLSASIFAVCFMVLLIFLGIARNQPAEAERPDDQPIEATRDLRLVTRRPAGAEAMVDLLYRHGHPGPADQTVAIDVFADRIEVRMSTDPQPAVLRDRAIAAELPALLAEAHGRAAGLYVFANEGYGQVAAAIGRLGLDVAEISVPRGLRDAARPDLGWSAEFSRLDAEQLEPSRFRERLAVLLAGSADTPPAPAGAQSRHPTQETGAAAQSSPKVPSVTAFWAGEWEEFQKRLGLLLPLFGVVAVALIRRRGDGADMIAYGFGNDTMPSDRDAAAGGRTEG